MPALGEERTIFQNIANVLQILVAAGVAYFVGFTFALVIWTFRDIQSRTQDVVVQILATLWVAIMNVPGLIIYLILRPHETLVEAYERSLEEESLLQDVENRLACPNCRQRIQADFLLCPNCLTQLKHQCSNCAKVLHLRWKVCPYCGHEEADAGRRTSSQSARPPLEGADDAALVRERPIPSSLARSD